MEEGAYFLHLEFGERPLPMHNLAFVEYLNCLPCRLLQCERHRRRSRNWKRLPFASYWM